MIDLGAKEYEQFILVQKSHVNILPQIAQVFLTDQGGEAILSASLILQQLASKIQKKISCVTFTPTPLLSWILYYHWYLGWRFNTHVKKVESNLH